MTCIFFMQSIIAEIEKSRALLRDKDAHIKTLTAKAQAVDAKYAELGKAKDTIAAEKATAEKDRAAATALSDQKDQEISFLREELFKQQEIVSLLTLGWGCPPPLEHPIRVAVPRSCAYLLNYQRGDTKRFHTIIHFHNSDPSRCR